MTPRALFWHLIETKYSLTEPLRPINQTLHRIFGLKGDLWPLDGFQHSRQTRKHKSRIPCPIFGESRFLGNSQIPDPFNIFIVSRFLHHILVKSRIPKIPFQTLFIRTYTKIIVSFLSVYFLFLSVPLDRNLSK